MTRSKGPVYSILDVEDVFYFNLDTSDYLEHLAITMGSFLILFLYKKISMQMKTITPCI